MLLLIGAVVLGFVMARLDLLPRFLHVRMGHLGTLALILLLFSMGISMGSNSEIISNLPKLGGKALVLSISTIAGSVFFVWIGMRLTTEKTSKKLGGARQ